MLSRKSPWYDYSLVTHERKLPRLNQYYSQRRKVGMAIILQVYLLSLNLHQNLNLRKLLMKLQIFTNLEWDSGKITRNVKWLSTLTTHSSAQWTDNNHSRQMRSPLKFHWKKSAEAIQEEGDYSLNYFLLNLIKLAFERSFFGFIAIVAPFVIVHLW